MAIGRKNWKGDQGSGAGVLTEEKGGDNLEVE